MTIDGDILELDLDIEFDEVLELYNFVKDRLKYIEEVQVAGERDKFGSSALLQLLFSMKKAKPSLKIPLIDDEKLNLKEFGNIHWIR